MPYNHQPEANGLHGALLGSGLEVNLETFDEPSGERVDVLETRRRWGNPLLILMIFGMIGFLGYLAFRLPAFRSTMLKAPVVVGQVVARAPEGAFPTRYEIEYRLTDGVPRRIVLRDWQLRSDTIEDGKIELRCFPDSSNAPMTLTQIYSYNWGNYFLHLIIMWLVFMAFWRYLGYSTAPPSSW